MTRVVHCKKEKFDVYIGRPSEWGNPWSHRPSKFTIFLVETREEAVKNFREWLLGENFQDVLQWERTLILTNLHKLKGKTLGCWCNAEKEACHGQVYIELLEREEQEPGFIRSLRSKNRKK